KKWYIHRDGSDECPFCHTRRREKAVRLVLKSEERGRKGVFRDKSELLVYDRMPLYSWHVFANVHNDEKASADMRAYVAKQGGRWLLVNYGIDGMTSPSGRLVPKGSAVELSDGAVFRMTDRENGLLCEVVT
ncbi:MAG: hypothetical protein ACI4J8_05585, partial [Oscillospiraceae bacterium]